MRLVLLLCLSLGAVQKTGDEVTVPGQETHTVQPGDTLWDLTSRFLNNPWYWPKVWSYNPQLSNPHFIYPGQVVRFIPGGEETPGRIEASASREMPQDEQDAPPPEPQEPAARPTNDVSVAGNRPLSFNSSRGMIVQTVQLVTPKELQESGELTQAFDDKMMLSTYDLVYLKYKKGVPRPNVGQSLIVYKVIEEVEHPVSGRDVGYLTQITGTMEVLKSGYDTTDKQDKGETLVTARVTKTFEPIERGQLVAQQKNPLYGELIETPNGTKLEGVLLTGEHRTKQIAAQFHYVFVDKGTNDGVRNGNQFQIVRNRDYYTDTDGDLIPEQIVGKAIVVDAKETASLALITQSLLDLHPGDRMRMR